MKMKFYTQNAGPILVGIIACMAASTGFAKCEPTIEKNYPGAVPPNYYGNSQTDSFRCATTGGTELTSLQQSERNELIPEKLSNRYYIIFGGNAASEAVTRVKNESIYDPVLSVGTISSTTEKTASNNIELGFGYTWSDFAIDVEWLASKSVSYNASIMQITPVLPFSTTLKGDALLMNIYWFFNDQYNFKMYGVFDIGISSNKTTATLNGGPVTVTKRISPSLGIGVGARFNIISKLSADMAARFIILGKAKYAAADGIGHSMILSAYRTWTGVSARLIWLI